MNIQIFVINLDKDTERLHFMESQFQRHHIVFERFSAIFPWKITQDQWDAVDYSGIKEKYAPNFRPWEVACAYSHRAIMEKIVAEDIPVALILEDDVVLDEAFFSFLDSLDKNIHRWIHPKWDYLQCNYHIMDFTNFGRFFGETLRRMKGSWLLSKIALFIKIIAWIWVMVTEYCMMLFWRLFGSLVIYPLRSYSMAGTYFITQEGARKILETMNDRIIAPADIIQNIAKKEKGLKMRILVPQLSVQDLSFESNTLNLK